MQEAQVATKYRLCCEDTSYGMAINNVGLPYIYD